MEKNNEAARSWAWAAVILSATVAAIPCVIHVHETNKSIKNMLEAIHLGQEDGLRFEAHFVPYALRTYSAAQHPPIGSMALPATREPVAGISARAASRAESQVYEKRAEVLLKPDSTRTRRGKPQLPDLFQDMPSQSLDADPLTQLAYQVQDDLLSLNKSLTPYTNYDLFGQKDLNLSANYDSSSAIRLSFKATVNVPM